MGTQAAGSLAMVELGSMVESGSMVAVSGMLGSALEKDSGGTCDGTCNLMTVGEEEARDGDGAALRW